MSASRRSETDPPADRGPDEGVALPLASLRSGRPSEVGARQGFRLHGRLYLIAPGARIKLADWRKRQPLIDNDLRSSTLFLDSFIRYHLTAHGEEMWIEDRREDGPITLHDLWEVTYLIDPDSRPLGYTNRKIRRDQQRKRRKR